MAKAIKVKEEKTITETQTPTTSTKKEVELPVEQLEEPFKKDPIVSVEVEVATNKIKVQEELTPEEKIMKYVEEAHSDTVDLVPVLRSLYPMPTFAEPAGYLLQNESKKIKFLLECMVKGGKLKLLDDTYLLLGKPYWKDGGANTQHHTINSLKIMAVK